MHSGTAILPDLADKPEAPDFDGYPNEIEYTFNYFQALAPTFLRLTALNQGVSFPNHRPLRYLELGCGNGVSLNIHAAADPGEYWGIDVNPSHAAFASRLAETSGSGARILNCSFADLLDQRDLPEFDVIVAHGVWSHISENNEHVVVELLRRSLVAGGIFYLSHWALPGAAAMLPLQRLLWARSESTRGKEKILDRLMAGIALASELRRAGSSYYAATPHVMERIDGLAHHNPAYLCHEYLGEHWRPVSFFDAARTFSEAGLRFVGSASFVDQFGELVFSPAGLQLLATIDDPQLRETVADFLRNRQFRRDVYVKDGRALSAKERRDLLFNSMIVPVIPIDEVEAQVETPVRAFKLSEPPFNEVLAALAEDWTRPKTLRDLMQNKVAEDRNQRGLLRAIFILIEEGIVFPAKDGVTQQAGVRCRDLNNVIMNETTLGNAISALASPVTGCGVGMKPTQQLFFRAILGGSARPEEWVSSAQAIGNGSGVSRNNGGQGPKLLAEALRFSRRLPVLEALRLVELHR